MPRSHKDVMYQRACRFIFFRLLGWKYRVSVPDFPKCIICVAPHTSNWDFLIAELFYGAIGRQAGFFMKKEWFFFPLKYFWKAIGGVPVNRKKKSSLVEQTIAKMKQSENLRLAITPEGTRKRNSNWKYGFYYIALGANVPIVLYAIDYKNKLIVGEHAFIPTGEHEEEIAFIKHYYNQFRSGAKHPERFSTGL